MNKFFEVSLYMHKCSFVYNEIKKFWPQTKLIWNDISGKLDADFSNVIKSLNSDFTYILCHNLSILRNQSVDHMQTIYQDNFYESLCSYFDKLITQLKSENINYFIDPCFGFSKTRVQNHFLLQNINNFIHLKELLRLYTRELRFKFYISQNC